MPNLFKSLFSKNRGIHTSHAADSVDATRIIDEKTPFGVREAFRSLYTNIVYLPIADKCKKFAVTSACMGEGKTYISINLSITLAQCVDHGKKVLLIDGDMRSPRIARLLKSEERISGLSEFLVGIDEKPNFNDTDIPNLKVLYSGAKTPNPARLINSSRMQELISICEEEFDYIIIDTPPVNIVTDTMLLSSFINNYLIVVRADYSDINSVSEAVETLSQVDAEVAGLILCNLNPKSHSVGSGRYGRYGKYGKYGKYSRYKRYGGVKYGNSKYGDYGD